MTVVFFVMGILAILYFPVLCADSRRWNPTFASFWIVFGIGCLLAGAVCRKGGKLQESVVLAATILFLVFLYIERKILMAFQRKAPAGMDYLIILGARVNGYRPSAALRKRLDEAAGYLRENPKTRAIVSGGQGPGEFVTEAEAMKKVLLESGFAPERIIMEDCSTSTEENLRFCGRILDRKKESVGIVTNDFHIYRSVCLAKRLGYKRCYGVSADSEAVSLLNYLVREFFAVVKESLWRKKERDEIREEREDTDEQSR